MSFARSNTKRFVDFKSEAPSPTRYFQTERLATTETKTKRTDSVRANPRNPVNMLPRGPKRNPVQGHDLLVNHLLLEQQETEKTIQTLKEELEEERHERHREHQELERQRRELERERQERERLQNKVKELQRKAEQAENEIVFNIHGNPKSNKNVKVGSLDVYTF